MYGCFNVFRARSVFVWERNMCFEFQFYVTVKDYGFIYRKLTFHCFVGIVFFCFYVNMDIQNFFLIYIKLLITMLSQFAISQLHLLSFDNPRDVLGVSVCLVFRYWLPGILTFPDLELCIMYLALSIIYTTCTILIFVYS